MKSKKQLEALDLIGLAILERQSIGKPEHEQVKKAHAEAVERWKLEHKRKTAGKCPHCGEKL